MPRTLGRLPQPRKPLPAFGTKFSRLTVIANLAYKDHKNGQIKIAPMCRCECGTVMQVDLGNLISAHTQSCGCFMRERISETQKKHGLTLTPEYNVWAKMKQRMLNPNNKRYESYGGRGLSIEPAWVDSFEAFFADMGPRPEPHLTLERVDNDLGYVRGNVVWDTREVQNRNKRSNVWVTYKGESMILFDAANIAGLKAKTVYERRKQGWPEADWFLPTGSKRQKQLK